MEASLPDGDGFKVRFAPDMVGLWNYTVSVKDSTGTDTFSIQSLIVLPKNQEPQQRFCANVGNSNYLEFDNGDQHIPVGENISAKMGTSDLDYKKWLDKLVANEGNSSPLACSLGPGNRMEKWLGWFPEGLRKYKEANSMYQDWLFDYCAETGFI
ncbi:MAG: hypothetical protein R3B93_26265 [Bacteroidia bacterium]